MIFRILFPLLGLLFIVFTYWTLRSALSFVKDGTKVSALVKAAIPSTDGGFYPLFEYQVNGKTFENSIDNSSPKWPYRIGTQQDIICHNKNPNKIKVVSFGGLFLAPIALSCVGIVLLTISTWNYWYVYIFK